MSVRLRTFESTWKCPIECEPLLLSFRLRRWLYHKRVLTIVAEATVCLGPLYESASSVCILGVTNRSYHLKRSADATACCFVQNFRPSYWYYEVIEKVRLVLISCIGLLFLPGTASQVDRH